MTPTPPPADSWALGARLARRAPAFAHRRFALYWLGSLVSTAGTQMQVWALFWHISRLTPNPIAVAGVGLARFLPIILLSLIAGVTADRYDRRKIMFLTQSVMALAALALAALTALDAIRLWHIYLLTAVQAAAAAFDAPARQSLVPNLVDRARLPSAFSLNSIASNTGSIAGPALSGLVIAGLGQPFTYLFNALSFGAVLLALVVIGTVAQQVAAPGAGRLARRVLDIPAISEGVRFIFRQPVLLSSMILDFLATFFSSANTLLPFVAQQILHVGPVEYGWLSAAQAVGAVTAGLVLAQRHNLPRQGRLLLAAVAVFGLATVVFGLSTSYWLTLAALIVVGGADSISTILRNTIRQIQTPDQLRGRMVSVNQIFFMGGPQLGEIEAGAVAQAFGLVPAIVSGGIGCILAAAWVAARWPQLAGYDGSRPGEPVQAAPA